jgi:hypothetical protein
VGSGSVPGLLLGKTTDPLTSCEVEAMAELMTARLAELVSARLSDGRRVPNPSAQVKSSGRRPNAKAVVSAMPAVKAKARARITAIFFMAVPLFSEVEIARTGKVLP